MSFLKFLHGIGDKLGILEVVSKPEFAPAVRIRTRIISLRELSGEIRAGDVRALAESPAELAVPFENIFEAAGISSKPEDWTIQRLKGVVESETARQKPREDVQKSVLELLKTQKVSVETLIKDAIARDQALDSFEDGANEKIQSRKEACQKRLLDLESRMKELQHERTAIEASLDHDENRWREWRKLKRAYEKDIASVVSYIVDHQVITTDDEGTG